VLPVTVRVAIYCPGGKKAIAEFTETVTLLGLLGLAVPPVCDKLIQLAYKAELYVVFMP
jgi:hypothetical protein